ncbi:hypothetical protein ID866_3087 [Astraeus odoratus]|nr:hypothetical protein ID866_3087 [Astraeus odoratus]
MLLRLSTSLLLVLPLLVSAAIFPPNTKVKMLDPKGFKRVMKSNVGIRQPYKASSSLKQARSAQVWLRLLLRGAEPFEHCQRMSPEYSKAAGTLSPLVPFYAVDCDADTNKALCSQQVAIV